MSVLGHARLIEALSESRPTERLFVTPILNASQIREASIDIRLGNDFLTIKRGNIGLVDPMDRTIKADRSRIHHRLNRGDRFFLHPNEMALASTIEYFRFPTDISASVTSRSKWGRLGLVIATATAVHPGFKGSITLELINHSNVPLALYPGLMVAQMIFYECDGASEYKGDLGTRVAAHPTDVTQEWQEDIEFWKPEPDRVNLKSVL